MNVYFVDMSQVKDDGTVPVWNDAACSENAGFAWVGLPTLDEHHGTFKFKGDGTKYPKSFFDYPEGPGSWHKPPTA